MTELMDRQDERTARSRPGWRLRRGTWILGTVGVIVLLVTACAGEFGPLFFTGGTIDSPNFSPSLEITNPVASQIVTQGESFLITWTDSDPDSAAEISFDLVDTQTDAVFPIVDSIKENGDIDSWSASTDAVPLGQYFLRGRITDYIATTEVFAELEPPLRGPVSVIIISPEEYDPTNQPPYFNVVEPAFSLSVIQGDVLVVSIQPLELEPNSVNPACGDSDDIPYDPDNEVEVEVFLDYDNDPTNDDPSNPNANELIFLTGSTIAQCGSGILEFNMVIDLDLVPVRPDGSPYWVRVLMADGVNPPVNNYAAGTITVVPAD